MPSFLTILSAAVVLIGVADGRIRHPKGLFIPDPRQPAPYMDGSFRFEDDELRFDIHVVIYECHIDVDGVGYEMLGSDAVIIKVSQPLADAIAACPQLQRGFWAAPFIQSACLV
ncbi:hypothetical protein FOZ61_010728 [Perkinsus olseni]|uniref:Uncharacterized protein n=1 Tax=Perkinsus olseni TaxID=32597 RepID=A0A7J6M2C2_PEROL|nr:hypothetical protein FOZ61_010728 [Perkinsus olseni]